MQLTRRAFLTSPLQSIRADMEHAGHWLRRARGRAAFTASIGDGEEAGNRRNITTAAPHIGLREARAHLKEKQA